MMLPIWKACKEELPDVDTTVMTYSPDSCDPVYPGFYDGEGWQCLDGMPMQMEVTHWMSFPDPPER